MESKRAGVEPKSKCKMAKRRR
ncbi:hypothetical protein LINPERHAP2_LOCUS22971 [Linum perenne]